MNLGGSGIWSPVPQPLTKAIMSLAGSKVSSFSRIRSQDWMSAPDRYFRYSVAYTIIFHANLRNRIGESPHDILHHNHPVLLKIVDMLQSQIWPMSPFCKLTSQKPLHSDSHFCVVPSSTLTNCLKSCSFPPIVWRTLSSLAWTFSSSFPCDKAALAVYELSLRQSDSYFSLAFSC